MVDLTEDKEVDVEFMYTVEWRKTNTSFEKRMEKYFQSSLLPHHLKIHWFSVMNSCVTVLTLIGSLVTFYMQVLRRDIIRYAYDEEVSDNQEETTGWKYIHSDVFRYPKHVSLFTAALSSGTQLFTLTTAALPLGTIAVIFLIWLFVASPLLWLGGIAGKNSRSEFQVPCRITKCLREIPPLHWYKGVLPQMALAGILPFGVIYIELGYVFYSVWGHRIYTICHPFYCLHYSSDCNRFRDCGFDIPSTFYGRS
ncbi:hypothetical protein F0562_012179 [Nyssa sinensis]|uniref:Transmembrane 9 superfamily member n=1 Tax=Nyssa sinensis TaxID=561372 RepID=A0A5J4ZWN1_9ASTE|nr:hypothetical protein F0562_012179 [Nyssa sinensis]